MLKTEAFSGVFLFAAKTSFPRRWIFEENI